MENYKHNIIIPQIPRYIKVLDTILYPLMYVLGYGKKDSLQETHARHCEDIDGGKIDNHLCLKIEGDSDTWMKKSYHGLHHIPFLGGWKNYVILEVDSSYKTRFIGWKSDQYTQIHKLPIIDPYIKMLKGASGTSTLFFALDESGNQIPISLKDSGKLGDMKYPNVRLF